MNLFHLYMQGAAQAAIDAGTPLIDEDLSMIIDDGYRFMLYHPDASLQDAAQCGRYRVEDPTGYSHLVTTYFSKD